MPRQSIVGAILLAFATGQAVAAPFTDAEVEQRMAAGANLAAVCRVDATIHKEIAGKYCLDFLYWVRDEFPQIAPSLKRATPQTLQHFENYKTNLAIIAEIAESVQTAASKAAE